MKQPNPLLDDVTTVEPVIKSCKTCAHSDSWSKCVRTGLYCSTEMQYGGQCNKNGELTLWEQKPGVLTRLWRWLV